MSTSTALVTSKIGSIADAARAFSQTQYRPASHGRVALTPMVLVPDRSACSFSITIPEGMHALVSKYGKFEGIWAAGFHWASPMYRVSHLVTKQFIVFDIPVKECPTLDNVFVEIDISTVLHVIDSPESVKSFVYKLGPERLEQMLTAFLEEAVRTMARKKRYENIYDLMETEEFENIKRMQNDTDEVVMGNMEDENDYDESGRPILREQKDDEDEEETEEAGKQEVKLQLEEKKGPTPQKRKGKSSSKTDLLGSSGEETGTEELEMAATGVASASAPEPEHPMKPPEEAQDFDHQEQLENTKRAVNEKLNTYGVEVYSITIINVKLPANFAREMEQATTYQSKNANIAMKQKYDLLCLHHAEKQKKLSQKLLEDRQAAASKAKSDEAAEQKKFNLVGAETQRLLADSEEKYRAEIRRVKADTDLKVMKLEKQAEVLKSELLAQAHAEAHRISVETAAFVDRTRAEAQVQVQRNAAKTLLVRAQAENFAAEKLRARREYEAQRAHLLALKNMAQNGKLSVSGHSSDNIIAQLMASHNASVTLGLK